MGRSVLETELARIGQLQAHLSGPVAVLLGALAAGALLPAVWLLTRHFNTMAHEGTHAAVHSLMGHRITGVKLNPDGTAGTTSDKGPAVTSLFLGYLGPSLFGLAGAELIRRGHMIAVLWLTMALLLCLLVISRSVFGVIAVLACGVALFLVAGYTSIETQVVAAYLITWFLLLSAVRIVMEHGRGAGDAAILRERTSVPRGVWSFLWHVCSIVALVFGITLLV